MLSRFTLMCDTLVPQRRRAGCSVAFACVTDATILSSKTALRAGAAPGAGGPLLVGALCVPVPASTMCATGMPDSDAIRWVRRSASAFGNEITSTVTSAALVVPLSITMAREYTRSFTPR